MSNLVLETASVEIANLTKKRDAPVEPFGYGVDISAVEDVDSLVREVSGSRLLAEYSVRMITTPRGSIPGSPLRGIDVRKFLNSPSDISTLETDIRNELAKDDRLATVSVSVSEDRLLSNRTLVIRIVAEASDPESSFDLTFAVTSGSVVIEALNG